MSVSRWRCFFRLENNDFLYMSDCVCCCLWYYITTVSVLLKKQAAKRYRNRTEWKVIAQYIIKTQLPERLTRNKKDSLVKSMFKLEWNCSSVIMAQSKLSNCTWKLLSRYICFKPQLFYARAFSLTITLADFQLWTRHSQQDRSQICPFIILSYRERSQLLHYGFIFWEIWS